MKALILICARGCSTYLWLSSLVVHAWKALQMQIYYTWVLADRKIMFLLNISNFLYPIWMILLKNLNKRHMFYYFLCENHNNIPIIGQVSWLKILTSLRFLKSLWKKPKFRVCLYFEDISIKFLFFVF